MYRHLVHKCFQCEKDNPDGQTFCGFCRGSLNFSSFIAERVKVELSTAVKDRDLLELESSVKVFERAWSWMKLLGAAASIVVAIGAVVFAWNIHDLRSTVSSAKNAVTQSATEARDAIGTSSATSLSTIQRAASEAKISSQNASRKSEQLSREMDATAKNTNAQLRNEAAAVKQSVAVSQAELSSANKLRPDIESLRLQLTSTTKDLAEQRRLLSSSEDLAKKILSSRVQAVFGFDSVQNVATPVSGPTLASPVYGILPPPPGGKTTTVYMLLPSAPIENTVQLQFHISVQPPGSFVVIHNLIIFFWGDPSDNLRQHELSAGYFPDSSDRGLYKVLTLKDGRFFGDGQLLPTPGR